MAKYLSLAFLCLACFQQSLSFDFTSIMNALPLSSFMGGGNGGQGGSPMGGLMGGGGGGNPLSAFTGMLGGQNGQNGGPNGQAGFGSGQNGPNGQNGFGNGPNGQDGQDGFGNGNGQNGQNSQNGQNGFGPGQGQVGCLNPPRPRDCKGQCTGGNNFQCTKGRNSCPTGMVCCQTDCCTRMCVQA